jgi:hypothetical protein
MNRFPTSRVLGALAVTTALTFSGMAFAFFTTTGSGSGTAKVGKLASTIELRGSTTGELFPGGAAVPVTVHVKNKGTGSARVESVSLSSIEADSEHSSCVTSITGEHPAFTMAAISVNKTLAQSEEVETTGSLQMNDTGVSQNGCQGAALTLKFVSN